MYYADMYYVLSNKPIAGVDELPPARVMTPKEYGISILGKRSRKKFNHKNNK